MMKLKNLVCDTDQIAKDILKHWKYDEGSLEFWRGSANYVYYFTCENEKYWLRFSKDEENSFEQIKAEIELMLYLKENRYPCVSPISSRGNNYVEVVKSGINEYYAVVFSSAAGINLDLGDMTELQFECWGRTLASMHNLSESFKPIGYGRISWIDMLKYTRNVLDDFQNEKQAIQELNTVEKWLNSLTITKENYGLVHYDFELDNVFFNEATNNFETIDFDSAVYHWYVMDIVCALGDLKDLESTKAEIGLKCFLKGYRSVRNIEEEYLKLMPKFERFDNIVTFAKLLRSLQNSNFDKEPVWLQRLRPRLLKKCDDYREGFKKEW